MEGMSNTLLCSRQRKTIDAMWQPTLNETYALYDGRLNDSMLVKLAVGVTRPSRKATPMLPLKTSTLNVAAPGVLANDVSRATPLTAQLVSNVTVGTLTSEPRRLLYLHPTSQL